MAESLVFLCHYPGLLIVETHLDMIFSVSSVVNGIIGYSATLNLTLQTHLEKVSPAKIIQIFRTGLHMLQEDALRMERVAESALRGYTMLKTLR